MQTVDFDAWEFTEPCIKALEKVLSMVVREGIKVAEIGSWKGLSSSVIAKMIFPYHGKLFAIDHWMGSEGVKHHEIAKTLDIYSIFKQNMIALGFGDIVHPLVMDSQMAAEIFKDGILDLVFIDADHRYSHINEDISLWLPKLRDNGIICGHDCEGYYSAYTMNIREIVNEHLETDYIFNLGIHPGVVKALYNHFQDDYFIIPNSTVWYKTRK